MKIEYDPKCEELAKWFLDDEYGNLYDHALAGQLAGVIQKAIEDWIEERTPGFEAHQEPDDVSGQGE